MRAGLTRCHPADPAEVTQRHKDPTWQELIAKRTAEDDPEEPKSSHAGESGRVDAFIASVEGVEDRAQTEHLRPDERGRPDLQDKAYSRQ